MRATHNDSEIATLHFQLAHLPDIGELEVRVGGRRYQLKKHTRRSLEVHGERNRALALLPYKQRALFTHYATSVALPANRAVMLRVVCPAERKPDLPQLVLLAIRTPRRFRKQHRQKKATFTAADVPLFRRLNLKPKIERKRLIDVSIDADDLLSTADSAVSLIFQHPQLATVDPATATVVIDDHIQAASNALNVARLQGTIENQGTGWNTITNSTDSSGNTLVWGPNFTNAGQPVQCYQLSSTTTTALATPLGPPLTTTQNDPLLQNSSWASTQGLSSVGVDGSASQTVATLLRRSKPIAAAAGANESADFTLNNLSPGYGLTVDASSFVFIASDTTPGAGTASINVLNTYLRSLWAWVQFYDAGGNSLGDWQSVGLVSPVNVVLGIPMPTDPTPLSFDWPATASSAVLAHGGLGTSNWNNELVWSGALLTGVFNYAIPVLFLVAGAEISSNAWLKACEEEAPIQVAVIKYGTSILGSVASSSVCFPNLKSYFTAFADGIAGILAHKGLEALQQYVITTLGEEDMEEAIPYVNMLFQVANRAIDLVEIGETTVAVLLSPAVYEVSIQRSMPLTLVVSPDPTHGTPSNPAIWPLDSSFYEAVVQYQGATPYTMTAPMGGANSSTPITVNFASLPEGGTMQAQFSVYSSDDALLGRWTSGPVAAVRPTSGATLQLSGAIQETLVPLTSETFYSYQQKLVYDQGAHMWQPNQFTMDTSVVASLNAGTISSTVQDAFNANGCSLSSAATVTVVTQSVTWKIIDGSTTYLLTYNTQNTPEVLVDTSNAPTEVLPLNQSDTGNNLGGLVGMTMNDPAYMLGYCWMASGQNVPAVGTTTPLLTTQTTTFQNINVLASPEDSLKFSGVGFAIQPLIAYQQYGPVPLFDVPSSYASSLESGTVPAGLVTLFAQFSYPLPSSGVTVSTAVANEQWTISVSSTPTYSLVSAPGQINVYAYPAITIGQNNFYLEPTITTPPSYQYQLRQVVLDDVTPFDMSQTTSWGLFQFPGVSDVVVHPQGYVIATHTAVNMLEILQLPNAPSPDADAMPAVPVGGLGTRPGLFSQPVAAATTTDGRILVLEQGNQRIQAIDVNGNPVPCFSAGMITSLDSTDASTLDAGLVSSNVRSELASANVALSTTWWVQDEAQIFQLAAGPDDVTVTSQGTTLSTAWTLTDSSATPQVFTLTLGINSISVTDSSGTQLFEVPTSVGADLDAGSMDSTLSTSFTLNNVTLVLPVAITGNGFTLDSSVTDDLCQGNVPATLTSGLATRNITLSSSAAVTASVVVTIIQSTAQWQLTDTLLNATYALTVDSTTQNIDVVQLVPVMALNPPPAGQTLTYLGIATETKGYIYVLSYTGQGTDIDDFLLDIYQPDGTSLATNSGVNAGAIVVDMWRNLYTLNYESFLGPGGRTEPSVSIWTPST